MNARLEEVKKWAKDLRTEEPRSPEARLGGLALGARCLDKCRAMLLGWEGDYAYGCPLDREFLAAVGISKEAFEEYVATGASDSEVDRWVRLHAYAKV